MKKNYIPYMTNVEVAEAAAAGRTLLLPLGTVESNGPHQLLGCDFIASEALVQAVTERTSAVRMPTFHYGISELHAGLPGTFALSESLFSSMLDQLLSAAARMGFQRAVLFNCHRHNHQPVEILARRLRKERKMAVAMIDPLEVTKDLCKDLFGNDPAAAVGHGGEPLMSLTMHLRPHDVQPHQIGSPDLQPFMGLPATSSTRVKFSGSRVGLFPLAEEINASGAWADISVATAERGRAAFERLTDFSSAFVERFSATPVTFSSI